MLMMMSSIAALKTSAMIMMLKTGLATMTGMVISPTMRVMALAEMAILLMLCVPRVVVLMPTTGIMTSKMWAMIWIGRSDDETSTMMATMARMLSR